MTGPRIHLALTGLVRTITDSVKAPYEALVARLHGEGRLSDQELADLHQAVLEQDDLVSARDIKLAPDALRLWGAGHDNGWVTWIAERDGRIYVAWVSGPGVLSEPSYREDIEPALAAAAVYLERNGHRCSLNCGALEEVPQGYFRPLSDDRRDG
jgi:hypothetical protein